MSDQKNDTNKPDELDEQAQSATNHDATDEGEVADLDIGFDDVPEDALNDDEALSPMEALEKERDGYKDQLYRAAAEMENTKKRAARDVEAAKKYGPLGFIRDLTTAFDNMQRALESAPEDKSGLDETYKNILIGLEMTVEEITKIMEKHGVKVIAPEGEKFDYNFHQAMFEVPTDEVAPGTVVTVAQAGYVLHDRLIRPAMVGVAKVPDDQSKT